MARYLLTWEFGGGLGHAGRLRPLAIELLRRGHQVDLVLRDLVHTQALLADLPVRRFQAPVWLHQTKGLPQPTISLTEILLGNGYLQPDTLRGQVAGWRAILQATGADAVVADYAPTATLAARLEGRPVATIGIGFSLPPDLRPLPPFRIWEPVDQARVTRFEAQALASINTVLTEGGGAPLAGVADLLRGDRPLLCTWPELDHYQRGLLPAGEAYLGPTILPAAGEAPVWPEGHGPKVFAYLRAAHPEHAAVLQALDQAGCCTLVYMPEVVSGLRPPVLSPRLRYAGGPVHLGQALPACQLLVSHGGEATLAQAFLAGKPCLLLPLQAEQFLMALRAEATGAALNAASRSRPTPYGVLIRQMIDDVRHSEAAQALAQRHADFDATRQTQALADAFEALLPQPPAG